MPNPLRHIYMKYIWFCLVGFYGISTSGGYLKPNPLYRYILNIYDLVSFSFMAYATMVCYFMSGTV